MGAASVEPAPLIVPLATLELLEPEDDPLELELEPELLLLLEPQATMPSDEAATAASAAMRLGFTVISFALMSARVCVQRSAEVLSSCEPFVGVLCRLGGQSVTEAEVGVDEPPLRKRLLELDPQLSHVHVDRSVPGSHLAAPDETEQLLARHDPVGA